VFWKVNKAYDVNGNYIKYTYRKDDYEIAIDKIEYTGNASVGLAPYNTIEFYYTKKSDPVDSYIAGKKLSNTLLLTAVKSLSEGAIVRTLEFNYKVDLYTKLIEVVEKNKAGEQKNSTIINWENTDYIQSTAVTNVDIFAPRQIANRIFAKGDINGDGLDDFVVDEPLPAYFFGLRVMIATGIANDYDSYIIPGVSISRSAGGATGLTGYNPNLSVFDFDKDGKDEIYVKLLHHLTGSINYYNFQGYVFNGSAMTLISNGITSQTSYPGRSGNTESQDVVTIIPTDYDGDGIVEATFLDQCDPAKVRFDRIIEYNSSGTATNIISSFGLGFGITTTQSYITDFNGNGISDFCVKRDGSVTIKEYNPVTGTVDNIYHYANLIGVNDRIYWGDLNADGNTDMIAYTPAPLGNSGPYKVYLSDGIQLNYNAVYTTGLGTYNIDYIELHDFNNDGKVDVVQVQYAGTNPAMARLSMNDGSKLTYISNISGYYGNSILMDINGDGMPDHSRGDYNNNTRVYFGPAGYKGGNIVTSIVNGMNVRKEISYNFLKVGKAGGAYTQGSSASFGAAFKYMPMLVVTTVATKHHVGSQEQLSNMTYNYADAVFDKDKKGFLGFRFFKETYHKNGKVRNAKTTSMLYNSTFSMLYPSTSQTFINGDINPISSTEYSYSVENKGSNRYWSKLEQESSYDATNNVTTTTMYDYDAAGNANYINTSNGYLTVTTERVYSNINSYTLNRLTSETVTKLNPYNSNWEETSYSYSSLGNLEQTIKYPTFAKKVTTTYLNNALGLVERTTVSAAGLPSVVNKIGYDVLYRFPVQEYNALDQKTERLFNTAYGVVTWEKTPDAMVTSATYDTWGDPVLNIDEYGAQTTQSTVWTNPNTTVADYYTTSVQKPGTPGSITTFDILGNKEFESTKNDMEEVVNINYTYHLDGYLQTKTRPYKNGETVQNIAYTYDALDRVSTIIDNARGRTSTFSYSPLTIEMVVQGTTGTVEQITKVFNKDGTVDEITDLSGKLEYTYNSSGSVVEIKSTSGNTTLAYDVYGRQTTLTDPNAGQFTYEYNAYGQLIYEKDALNNIFTTQYDVLGRITSKTESATGKQLTYTYKTSGNGLNQANVVTDYDNVTQSYSYDSYHRVSSVIENVNGTNYTTSYAYANDDVTGITYPSGYSITQMYNTVGAVSSIKETVSNKVLWQLSEVNAINLPKVELLQNGYKFVKTYDVNFPQHNNLDRSNNTPVFSYYYSFDKASGNLLTRADNMKALEPAEFFDYDAMQRLIQTTTESLGSPTPMVVNTEFEANGNIFSKSDVSANPYEYRSTPNAVTHIPGPYSTIPSFDQNVVYNSRQLVQSITENNKVLTFSYGPDEERRRTVQINNGTQVNEHIYIGNYEKEIKASGTKQYNYVYSPYGLLGVMITQSGTDKFYYAYTDYMGTILGLMEENGTIAEEFNADPWGRRRNPQNWTYDNVPAPVLINRCYSGHEHLDDFGLINMNARLYDPLVGRMLSPDKYVQAPEYSQNMNRYSYAFNNPLKYTDPTGNTIRGAIPGATVGGGVNIENCTYGMDIGMIDWAEIAENEAKLEGSAQGNGGSQGGNGQGSVSEGEPTPPAGSGVPPWALSGSMTGIKGYGLGFAFGFATGVSKTYNFATSLGTTEGWQNFGNGIVSTGVYLGNLANPYTGPVMMTQMVGSARAYVSNIPNMNAFQLGQASGAVAYGALSSYALGVAGRAGVGFAANRGYTTIYRAVSKAELDDIAQFGLRNTAGAYETGKLFAPTLREATQFGKYNFKLDGIPNTLIKVKVPNRVMKSATRFETDGMNAILLPTYQLPLIRATPLNYSPFLY
jgi:RHS repeat-associated protein